MFGLVRVVLLVFVSRSQRSWRLVLVPPAPRYGPTPGGQLQTSGQGLFILRHRCSTHRPGREVRHFFPRSRTSRGISPLFRAFLKMIRGTPANSDQAILRKRLLIQVFQGRDEELYLIPRAISKSRREPLHSFPSGIYLHPWKLQSFYQPL